MSRGLGDVYKRQTLSGRNSCGQNLCISRRKCSDSSAAANAARTDFMLFISDLLFGMLDIALVGSGRCFGLILFNVALIKACLRGAELRKWSLLWFLDIREK